MELLINGKNLAIDASAENYIRDKIGKLERHLPDLDEVKVEITLERTKAAENRFVVQVTVKSHGALLRGEERAPNINAAIDKVVDVLNRQIERFKGKLYRSKRRNQVVKEVLAAEANATTEEEEVAEEAEIVRIKHFRVKPMSPEEAVEQMELLSHDFFIFYNAENDNFSVIYRRGDGNYGLIVPELS